jgi:hypothetical protein
MFRCLLFVLFRVFIYVDTYNVLNLDGNIYFSLSLYLSLIKSP